MTITFRSDLDTGELIAEIRFLGASDEPTSIAERLGYTVEGLRKRLTREGYPDLAQVFDSERHRLAAGRA